MSFLNLPMLLGLTAISVPIIIHFLNRRKFRTVTWAAMRFVRLSVDQNQRRMKIEDLILLLLRCALLALLALALARPALDSGKQQLVGDTKVNAVVLLDNSFSMKVNDNFEDAKKAAKAALDGLPGNSACALLLVSDVVDEEIPRPDPDLDGVHRAINEARLSHHATDLYPALQAAAETLNESTGLRKEIYLVTDGQRNGWRQKQDIVNLLKQINKDIKTHVIVVGDPQSNQQNLGISRLEVADPITTVGQAVDFEVEVENYGDEDDRDITLVLKDDQQKEVDMVPITTLPARETRTVTMKATFETDGYHFVRAEIKRNTSGSGADAQELDDTRSLVVRIAPHVRVLLLDETADLEDDEADRETTILKKFFDAMNTQGDRIDASVKNPEFLTQKTAGELAEEYHAIVLANISKLEDQEVTTLAETLRRGIGLIVFPGDKINPEVYREKMFEKLQILPAAYEPAEGLVPADIFGTETQFTLEPSTDHPIMTIWSKREDAFKDPRLKIFRRSPLRLAKTQTKNAEAGRVSTVMSFADGSPALLERAWGRGRVFQYATPADFDWGTQWMSPISVITMRRILGSLAQHRDRGLNLRVGEVYDQRLEFDLNTPNRVAKFQTPGTAPGERSTGNIEQAGGIASVEFADTHRAGIYSYTIGDRTNQVASFAVQPDSRESKMAEFPAEEWDDVEGRDEDGRLARRTNWNKDSQAADLQKNVRESRIGAEYWKTLMLLVLLIAGLETWLAQRFSRPK
ncbi:MAG: BatA domain-containing protein [Verrucomicrobiota bacterium]|nr:BatA domain-containing protein [Verrucomicrobiota bacterium]